MTSKSSPHPCADTILSRNGDTVTDIVALPNIFQEVKQKHLITKIKELVAECEDCIGLVQSPGSVPEIVVSPNLKSNRWMIIGAAYEKFTQHLSTRSLSGDTCGAVNQGLTANARTPHGSISRSSRHSVKRRKYATTTLGDLSNPRCLYDGDGMRILQSCTLQIRVNDRAELARWYTNAFLALQQTACRVVAKVWIKTIHPKKQATHPYNGQVRGVAGRDPHGTRPPYWPADVRHREPDHIRKDERTRLLVHLIMNTPQPVMTDPAAEPPNQQFLYAQDLLECLEQNRGKSELNKEHWAIIQQMIRTRELEEQYAAGGIDGDTLVSLSDYQDRSCSDLNTVKSDDNELGVDEDAQEVFGKCLGTTIEGWEPNPDSSSETSLTCGADIDDGLTCCRTCSLCDALVLERCRMAGYVSSSSSDGIPETSVVASRPVPCVGPESTMPIAGDRAPEQEYAAMLPGVGLHHPMPHYMPGRMKNHTSTPAMVQIAGCSEYAAGTLPSIWSGIMPDTESLPPQGMPDIVPTMTSTSRRTAYLGHIPDTAGEMHCGWYPTAASPMKLLDFGEAGAVAVPPRSGEPQHLVTRRTQNVSM